MLFWARMNVQKVDNWKFSFKRFPFLLKIYLDKSRRIAIKKSAQMGLTVWEMLDSFHKAWTGLNHIIFFPTTRLVTKFVQGRYNTLVGRNPKLQAIIKDGGGDTDNSTMKNLGKGLVYFSGLGAATKEGGQFDVISVPADGVSFDEVEKMHPKKVKLARRDRLAASPYKYERYLSTPGLPDYGIDAIHKETNQQVWMIKCTHCGREAYVQDDQKMAFPACIEPGYLRCWKCGLKLDPLNGRWVALYPDIKDFSGYHVSRLYDPSVDYVQTLKDYRECTSTTQLKDFHNGFRGETYLDNSQRVTAAQILRLCQNRPMLTKAPPGMKCSAGVDIGGQRKGIHCVISSPGKWKLRDIQWLGIIRDPGMGSELDLDFLFRDFVIRFGAFNVRKFAVDFAPETRVSRALVNRFKGKGWMCRYSAHQKKAYLWTEEPAGNVVEVNRTESLDHSHYLLEKGLISLPRQCPDVETFAAHCEHVVREVEEDPETGAREATWKKIGDDDYRHAFNYDAVCWYDGSRSHQKPEGSFQVPGNIRKELGL